MPTSDPELIQVSHDIQAKGDLVCVRVVGDSMLPRFHHGDKVVVTLTSQPTDGFVHLCRNQDGELTLKVMHRTPSGWELRSTNPDYPPVTSESWEVLGRAVHREESDSFGLRG